MTHVLKSNKVDIAPECRLISDINMTPKFGSGSNLGRKMRLPIKCDPQ